MAGLSRYGGAGSGREWIGGPGRVRSGQFRRGEAGSGGRGREA